MRAAVRRRRAIACCVSAMRVGKQMQFFGARVNLAKTLLYAINGGRDEVTGEQVGAAARAGRPATCSTTTTSWPRFDPMMDWLAETYVDALNCIHYMHDKYAYERIEMALHDRDVLRTHGLRHRRPVASRPTRLSAIKYAQGAARCATSAAWSSTIEIEGEFPTYGNNDDRADDIAVELVRAFMDKIRKHPTYRDAVHTQSVLTITSNVVYGKATGNTPDGREPGEPFAPGANPMNGRDTHGMLGRALSVAKMPYDEAAGRHLADRDGGAGRAGPHAATEQVAQPGRPARRATSSPAASTSTSTCSTARRCEDAMEHPENYPQLTIRVSGLRGELRPADPRAAARRAVAGRSTAASDSTVLRRTSPADASPDVPPAGRRRAGRGGRRELAAVRAGELGACTPGSW